MKHINIGNKNAEKSVKADAQIQMRVTLEQKNKLIQAAKGQSLTKFILSRCLDGQNN